MILGFTEEDLEAMNITETQMAANDDMVYAAFER